MNIKKIQAIIKSSKDPKEKDLLKRILDLAFRAQKTYGVTYTDFVDPFLLGRIKAHRLDILGFNLDTYGGLEDSQRHMMGFAHDDLQIIESDFPISYLKVSVQTGIGKPLSHRDYLGAIMGLGIEREKIGDLIIEDNEAYIIAHRDIAEYIEHALDTVSRYGKVTCQAIDKEDIPQVQQAYKTIQATVSSLRADAIIAAGFHLSRSAVAKLISAGRGLCNGVIITQSSPIEEGDICSLRGHGKIKIKKLGSKTRKGRIRLEIHRYI